MWHALTGDEDHRGTYPQVIRDALHKLLTPAADDVGPDQMLV